MLALLMHRPLFPIRLVFPFCFRLLVLRLVLGPALLAVAWFPLGGRVK
jgi:hypothetical protein